MRMPRKNNTSYGLLLALMLNITGCGGKTEKTAEQIRTEQIAAAEAQKEGERRFAQRDSELKNVTVDQIRALVSQCKSDVLALAKSDNRSPFAVFLVDEYSADIYQALAHVGGGSILNEEKMIKKAFEARKAGDKYFDSKIPLSHTVIFTNDSFSGPVKEAKKYACFIEPGLTLRTFSY